MENRVGHKVPSAAELQKVVDELEAIEKQLRGWCIDLAPGERSGGARFRQEGPAMAQLASTLSTRHGVVVKGASLDDLASDLAVLAAARQVHDRAARLTQLLADTATEAEREASETFHKYYSRLTNLAETDATLANEIAPLVEHMTSRRRKA